MALSPGGRDFSSAPIGPPGDIYGSTGRAPPLAQILSKQRNASRSYSMTLTTIAPPGPGRPCLKKQYLSWCLMGLWVGLQGLVVGPLYGASKPTLEIRSAFAEGWNVIKVALVALAHSPTLVG